MSERYDVVVVGGGAAGLAGAVALARSRRSVLVVDSGEPRNAPASHVHNFLRRDGTPPALGCVMSFRRCRAWPPGEEWYPLSADAIITRTGPTVSAVLNWQIWHDAPSLSADLDSRR